MICYSRCQLLQCKPTDGAPSDSGSLHCIAREQLEDVRAEHVRPRAASADPARRSKPKTVILKNIPTEYTRMRLCEKLAEHGFGYAIDFLYLPIDSSSGHNLGQAFVNVRTKEMFHDFIRVFQDIPASTCLPDFPSTDVCQVSVAEVQGREANMQSLFTSSNLRKWAKHEDWQPLFLDDYGMKIPFSEWQCSDDNGKMQPWQRCASAKSSPVLAPHQSPVLKPMFVTSQMKAETPEFVPQCERVLRLLGSPSLNPEAAEFVPSVIAMPPALDLGD